MLDFWREAFAVAKREFQRISQDARLRSVVILAPFAYAALMCGVYARHAVSELPVAVVSGSSSQAARQLTRMLDASPKIQVTHKLNSVEQLAEHMRLGNVEAGVVIPSDLSPRLKTGQDATVTAYLNAVGLVQANTLGSAITKVVQTFSAGVEIKALMKKGANRKQALTQFMPVKLDTRAMFNPSFNYSNFMVPGLLITVLQQVILLGLALTWAGEKEHRTLGQLFQVSRRPFALMLGKMLPYVLVNFLIAEIFIRVVFPLNDIPMSGDWTLAIGYTLLFVATIVSWGFWVSTFFKTRLFATQILMFIATPSFVLSGITWPIEAMPSVVQGIARMLPMTYFVGSFRDVYLAGSDFRYIQDDFLALAGFFGVNLLLSYLGVRRLLAANAKEQAVLAVEKGGEVLV